MSAKLVKVASAVGLSTFKHTLGGVPLAAGYGFGFWEVAGYSALGGILGVAIFIFLGASIQRGFRRVFPKKQSPKVFTRKNRFIVKVKKNFGLAGIAFITPWFLSVPIGTFISMGIYRNKRMVFLYQSASILLWSFLGAGLAQPIASLLTN